MHPDGYIQLKDRSKDIIISGGENISSIEVEDALYKHPAVQAAAVVAKPDDKWGETPCAFVELKPGAKASADELIARCKQNLAGYKVPRHIVFARIAEDQDGQDSEIQAARDGEGRVMQSNENRQVLLRSRPTGIPQAEHFEVATAPVPELAEGQILVRNQFLSVEPAMRGWVNAVANYSQPVGIGEVMRSFAAGTVIASKNPQFAEGDRVMGMYGWQDFAIVGAAAVTRKVKETDLPLSLSLGALGLNGVTAYFALLDVGRPRPGDTVVISTAAGSVGSAVGQIANIAGCRTVGIAGGPVRRPRSAARRSATMRRSTTSSRPLRRRSKRPARGASTCISTTRAGRSAMPCWPSLPPARVS